MKEWKKTGLSTLKKRTRSNRIPDTELAIMTMTIHAAGPSSRSARVRRPGRMKTDQRKALLSRKADAEDLGISIFLLLLNGDRCFDSVLSPEGTGVFKSASCIENLFKVTFQRAWDEVNNTSWTALLLKSRVYPPTQKAAVCQTVDEGGEGTL
jgi:hypothetical protein